MNYRPDGWVPLFLLVLQGVACGSSGGSNSSGGASAGGQGGQASTTTPTPTGGGTASDPEGPIGLRWVGRVDESDPKAVRFAWQGAGFLATVSGATIAVELRVEGTGAVYFQPVIDGKEGARFAVAPGDTQEVTLGAGLSAGGHRVELYRETEASNGVSIFRGFTAGTVGAMPAARAHRIEVVGDSISAGYGNLGSEVHPGWVADPACHWTAENSSWYLTYAAVAGRALDAEVSTIAHSGWGMYRDLGGSTTGVLSSIYDSTFGVPGEAPWSFPEEPDAIVVNLGTNDWGKGDPGEPYETAYVDFIAQLRTNAPQAHLFLTIGSMLGAAQVAQVEAHFANIVTRVQAATGDTKLSFFNMGTQSVGADGMTPTGCDWHPIAGEHERMAGVLEAELRETLGW